MAFGSVSLRITKRLRPANSTASSEDREGLPIAGTLIQRSCMCSGDLDLGSKKARMFHAKVALHRMPLPQGAGMSILANAG